ncbi:hypothetical protein BZG36_02058 [Bifiguratus adelaidae]|uniref:beta-N-acetylhexosaminidase n=1 Tax=Bifiguratus adelaidae TaxID=1938954 RepID=A0A261Y1Y6_9FUNG|nr:hypothetical protein BZG36_02058 [Bifiguratus adelaidae]
MVVDHTCWCNLDGGYPAGIYYGTRAILQMLVQAKDKSTLRVGSTLDWPDYELRGFMIDDGRKFFPLSFLKEYVKFMGWFKMNTFHLHLNDDDFLFSPNETDWRTKYAGFRLHSDDPAWSGLARGPNEWKIALTILPEFDTPAHALAFTQFNPKLASNGVLDQSYLNLNKTETYNLMKSEFRDYVDTMARYAWEKHGKHANVWGTGIEFNQPYHDSIDTNITISHWANWEDSGKNLTDWGYKVININDGPTYIVPKSGGQDNINNAYMLKIWDPTIFGSPAININTVAEKANLLAAYNLGKTTSRWETHRIIGDTMATMAQILWNGSQNETDISAFFESVKAVGQGPVNLNLEIPTKEERIVDLVVKIKGEAKGEILDVSNNHHTAKLHGVSVSTIAGRPAVIFSKKPSTVSLNLGTKGFNNTLAMWVQPSSNTMGTLLSSSDATLSLSSSSIEIQNDNYTYPVSFNTTLSSRT